MASELYHWQDCMQYATVTDIGMRRMINQDSLTVSLMPDLNAWRQSGHLFIVADGMGAHAAGELASKLAADGIPHHYSKYANLSPPEALHKAFLETNAEVHRRGQANTDFHNMGTTTSSLLLLPQGAVIGHVGDSRVYRLRKNKLEQLTFDHSLVWELREAGQISPEAELSNAIPKNVITRSLGPNPSIEVAFEGPFPVQVGDKFLLCSDGLTGQVDDPELCTIINSLEPAEAAQVLVDLANLRGGPDNITAIVVHITGPALATQDDTLILGSDTRKRRHAHPAFWVVAGACLLTSIFLFLASYFKTAASFLVIGVVSALVGLFQESRGTAGKRLGRQSRLGKGPYRQADPTAGDVLNDKLSTIVQQLREAADEAKWQVNWDDFNQLVQGANEASVRKQHSQALRLYGRAIRFMMQELREQKQRGQDE